jgi:GxxExxY protein
MCQRSLLSEETENVAASIVDAAFHVHSELGPGLLESVYETCLAYELSLRDLVVEKQVPVAVNYRGIRLDAGLRVDLLVGGCIVIELKAVEQLLPVHTAQLLTYLKLTGKRLGFLINFNVPRIKEGLKRVIL